MNSRLVALSIFFLSGTVAADGLDTAGAASGAPVSAGASTDAATLERAGAEVRYLVPHMRSVQFSAGIGGTVTTIITVTNGGATSCSAEIDFYFASNSGTPPAPVCTLSLALAPLLALGVDTINACSRPIPGDRWTLCTATCAPALTFNQGKAVIRVPQSCASGMTFDARLYHSDTADNLRALNALEVVRLRD